MSLTRRRFLKGIAAGALAAATTPVWAGSETSQSPTPVSPAAPFQRRGIHVSAGSHDEVAPLAQLIGQIAPALGLNWVIVEIDGGFQYKSHPECADENPITRDDARTLAALARDKGIQLVPMYNCLGHQSWHADKGALLRAHPEFNEAPDMDPNAKDFYCMSWCPNLPAVNATVFDLFDELIDAFDAKAFHVGMDEVFILGQCPRCKGTANATLFAKAVNDLHGHLVDARKVEMQMWGDRLLDGNKTGYGSWEASTNDTWQAIDMVPKDIVMCDWHYEMDAPDFPSVRFFQDKGFRVWPSGWNRENSIRRFIEVARKESGPRMVGYLCTTWVGITPVVKGLSGEPIDTTQREQRRLPNLIAGIKLGAAMAKGENPAPTAPPAPEAPHAG